MSPYTKRYVRRKNSRPYTCGTAVTLEIIGGKWKPAIILCLSKGLRRPQRATADGTTASRWVVNQQLKELEGHGIITKKIYPVLPPKVEYFLTEFGESLLPITQTIEAWGLPYEQAYEEILEGKNAPGPEDAASES
ncbi:winged helix-turn-helix transcriptional regulator [Siphonobacter curvatus]|uniref:Transcriptional regulator n=1 Tax=Siphonobacter curvatus TaxID=2094562 RepID=A0A2S7IH17_9BACT|nr:helix-turn-helix domain-containing protein [Siphonobacter curvatus]PQA54958.1 transcriptional regulator [Siphonobacter curvatus]